MTRFARSHGSKAANERLPEEATSWNVLKQQLLEQQAASKNNAQETITKQRFAFQKNEHENKKAEWAEFEETPSPKPTKKYKKEVNIESAERLSSQEKKVKEGKLHGVKIDNAIKTKKKITKKLKTVKDVTISKVIKPDLNAASDDLGTTVREDNHKVKLSKREKRNNKLKHQKDADNSFNSGETDDTLIKLEKIGSNDGSEHKLTKKQLKRKKNLQKKQIKNGFVCKPEVDTSNVSTTLVETLKENDILEDNHELKLTKQHIQRKKKQINSEVDCKPEVDNKNVSELVETLKENDARDNREPTLTKRQIQRKKSQLKKQLRLSSSNEPSASNDKDVETVNQGLKGAGHSQVQLSKRQKRNLKQKQNSASNDPVNVKGHKRRKQNEESTTMMINGQEVEVTMFDGFPVRKQDADHLRELRKQMIDNGIPVNEVKDAMKLERRKAEKALARERRKVCFHCRKAGHNLSDCPELGDGSNQDASATGICFKCGSTEHTHFECRVNRGQEYRFAKCFICQEQGHISRQCPDNPRGLYPKGGGCKVCGDVTHLKKDCPDLHDKKEQHMITVDVARGDKLEALDEDLRMENVRPAGNTPKNKIIKF